MRGIVIHETGDLEVVDIRGLSDMQAAVGGYIEPVRIPDGQMYVDEDGKMKGLAPNLRATAVANHWFDPLCGPVLVLGSTDGSGNDTPIRKACEARIHDTVVPS